MEADVLILGGGVAGLSLAAALAPHRRVLVLEAEAAFGYHSSGRSATFSHFGIGDAIVRRLTAASRSFFLAPPEGFSDVPVARLAFALFVATEAMLPVLERLGTNMAEHNPRIEPVDEAAMRALFPPLRTGSGAVVAGLLERHGLRIDADALLQGYARKVRGTGGDVLTDQRVERIEWQGGRWVASCSDGGNHAAPVLVNAAGAWADGVAELAGIPPLGLKPLRRTIILVDPPAEEQVRDWPFVKTAQDDFYVLPEGGRLAASAVDEVPCEACDAQPEEYDVALAAAKVEEYTTLPVRRIEHRWAGLRTFAPDRTPVVGFDPRAEGFFWLAGQGGFGLQTAPALADIAAGLILGVAAPDASAHELGPKRLIDG